MPESFQGFLKKLKENFNSHMTHLKNKDLSSTNNSMKNLLRTIFPDKLKKLFKTVKRSEIFLYSNVKR
jgi:hypothetical protein